MNNIQIDTILRRDQFSKKKFLGTFSYDTLPTKVKYPSCLIVNTQNHDQPGEHWLAIYYNKNKTAEFFDSFGMPPSFFNLQQYLEKSSVSFKFNSTQIQSYKSLYCGLYCIMYLLLKTRGRSLRYFLKFLKNPTQNDNLFRNLLKKYF